MRTLIELFIHELRDLYDAEHQVVDALPKMAEAAESDDLRAAFEEHLGQSRTHIERLERAFKHLDRKPTRKTCAHLRMCSVRPKSHTFCKRLWTKKR